MNKIEVLNLIKDFNDAVNPIGCENINISYNEPSGEKIYIRANKSSKKCMNKATIIDENNELSMICEINTRNNNYNVTLVYSSIFSKIPFVKINCVITNDNILHFEKEINFQLLNENEFNLQLYFIVKNAIDIIKANNPLYDKENQLKLKKV